MALTIVVETGSASASSNSYASVQNARDYSLRHLYASGLQNANQETLEAALVWATRVLDEQVSWKGTRNSIDQALEWPRIGVYDKNGFLYDNDEIPQWLIDATCELARALIAADRTADDFAGPRGFSQMTVGDLSLSIDKFDRQGVLPDSVVSMVSGYGTVSGSSGGMTVRLIRA
jgi:hypothetical protein